MQRRIALPLLLAAAAAVLAHPVAASAARVVIRVDERGYATAGQKRVIALSTRAIRRPTFTVTAVGRGLVLSARAVRLRRRWSPRWRFAYSLDLSHLRAHGSYRVRLGGALSPSFRVDDARNLFAPMVGAALSFFDAQRDGSTVTAGRLGRRPSHLLDAHAGVYTVPRYRGSKLLGRPVPTGQSVDVSGGWFDSGDYLKFTETASFDDVLLLETMRDWTVAADQMALARQARVGTDWLLKMWDAPRRTLYYQVGIGDGNALTIGDHDLWRLPQRDDRIGLRAGSAAYFLSHRPVFAAGPAGAPISPNLAGRTAAAFALCAQVFAAFDRAYAQRCLIAGQQLYDQAAHSWRGRLVSSTPTLYYSEPEWRDDMELGAIELYLATRALSSPVLPHQDPNIYLEPAATWADAYMTTKLAGEDSLNLYDVSTLAHYDLYRVMQATGHTSDLETDASELLRDLHDQLSLGSRLAARDPFGLANPAGASDTVPHALGYAVEARLYDRLIGKGSFEHFAAGELDWVLGRNAWGSSFVVGSGSTFPHCLSHQIANLSGSRTGRGAILTGAVVDGPNELGSLRGLGAPDGYLRCPRGRDRFSEFDGHGVGYRDDVRSGSTSEPTDDYTALSLLAFAQASTP
ncbi:MAG: glycoside hydrolase family 9 protein [Thermoleophilaceae bacterium]